jgi:hypothetical protein
MISYSVQDVLAVVLHLNDLPDNASSKNYDAKNFLNSIMRWLVEHGYSEVGSLIFAVTAFYLLLVSIKGNSTYGARTACFTFAPIT